MSETVWTEQWRDRVAWRLANLALRIGTSRYQEFIGVAIQRGLYELEEDGRELK